MAAVSFATPTAPSADGAPLQAASDKGRAFSSTFSDVTWNGAKPVETRSQKSNSKDKERGDRDDRKDSSADGATTVPVHAVHSAHTQDAKGSDDKRSDAKDASLRSVVGSAAQSATQPDDTGPGTADTSESPVDAAALAPVMDALKQLASATQQAPVEIPTPPQPVAAQADATVIADPTPATASLLAARFVPANAQQADAKPAASSKRNPRADAAADKAAAIDATATAAASDPQAQATPDSQTVTQPSASQQLAAGGADRALDVAKQGAWLDGLARDIAATGDSSSTLKFQAAPTHLGSIKVEIARGLEGAAVTLTASSEGARTALADAKPQLIAEARAQGIHITSAQVDVSTDSRQSGTGSQPDPRHDPRGGASFSSQTGGDGSSNANKQTRSQPFAINQTADSQPVVTAEVEESASSTAPAGGMYA